MNGSGNPMLRRVVAAACGAPYLSGRRSLKHYNTHGKTLGSATGSALETHTTRKSHVNTNSRMKSREILTVSSAIVNLSGAAASVFGMIRGYLKKPIEAGSVTEILFD